MALIYKIATVGQWQDAEAAGRFNGRACRSRRRVHSLLECGNGRGDGRQTFCRAGRPRSCRRGRRRAWRQAEMGSVARRRPVSPSLPRTFAGRSSLGKAAALARRRARLFGIIAVNLLYGLARPLFFAMDAEQAHGLTIRLLKGAAFLPVALGRSDARLRGARLRARFLQSAWHGRRGSTSMPKFPTPC